MSLLDVLTATYTNSIDCRFLNSTFSDPSHGKESRKEKITVCHFGYLLEQEQRTSVSKKKRKCKCSEVLAMFDGFMTRP